MKLAIDLGGTHIRIAQVENNRILQKETASGHSQGSEQEVMEHLYRLIDKLITPQTTGIGIGVPSVVDHHKGIVYNVMNIPSWKEVHLKDLLQERYHLPVSVNNDANCFALGEKLFGQGIHMSNLVGITLGTGVGAGIIINNTLYSGDNTGAGEIGSLPYLDADFESYCSSPFFLRHYGMSGRQAFQQAVAGNPEALPIWNEFGRHLGQLVKATLFAYDPTAIIFGGSISLAFPYFIDSLRQNISDFPYAKSIKNVHLLCSNNPDISLLGASAL